MDKEKTETIRRLNDRFRKTGMGGRILVTSGIQEFGEEGIRAIAHQVESYDEFDEANDPHGEHDFGSFDHESERIFWKIDYHGPDLMSGSEDPSDPAVTNRVLTIMLASEY